MGDIMSTVAMLVIVVLGFVMFRAPSVGAGFSFIGTMFSFGGSPSDALGYFSPYAAVMLILGVLFSAPVMPAVRDFFVRRGRESVWTGLLSVLCIPLFLWCVMTLASSAFNPFIYYIF